MWIWIHLVKSITAFFSWKVRALGLSVVLPLEQWWVESTNLIYIILCIFLVWGTHFGFAVHLPEALRCITLREASCICGLTYIYKYILWVGTRMYWIIIHPKKKNLLHNWVIYHFCWCYYVLICLLLCAFLLLVQFKIGLCQLSVTADKETNIDHACNVIQEAAEKGAQLVVLPVRFSIYSLFGVLHINRV